eukprot:CAMPEP_0197689812 /NCGR_PEP_ID=MMETSP1338-20131121/107424_1 /TAXON_ID=43686 ORGANISM="Pelagodinium beii, Strain RCC1491" /NCGR_SAMPLE_ID=MMETSP1338 /ASSEMBLY_ACC=CAM_ASM_000754 /LENGTH=224 /DNA_ID=CAMNT_0043272195 /DNA_START=204 /DNA_END=875 /DNA_ORIENTATION=-
MGNGGSSQKQMDNVLFNLKFTSKGLVRSSKKCEKNEKAQRKKVEKAIRKGNKEGARIYASNAIREKNQALNYLRLASRIDAVAARVETAVSMNRLTKSMNGVVKGMDKVLGTMDVGKISTLMDKFEEQFSDMDVRAGYMENAMGNATSTATPEHEVDALLQQVGDEHDLEVGDMLADVPADAIGAPAAAVSTGAGASPVAVGAGGAGTDRHHRGGGGGGGGSGG